MDLLDLLGYLAALTSRIALATGVLVLPNHHPVVLAKRAATVDALSGGRLRLCVGMGWMREEIEACGVDFGSRGRRADEQIEVLRALWEGDEKGVVGRTSRSRCCARCGRATRRASTTTASSSSCAAR
jgi:alkanesulfonate monooxygenase SsuD/methylene tetrahydromethanopterin reductase-like flavin-dependent oxidoreductase (luciferase family)